MALRMFSLLLALTVVVLGGCRTRSNYQPAPCPPAVVAVSPVPVKAPCPTPAVVVPPAPTPGVLVQP